LAHYIIVVCSKCGGYLLAKSGQKSRTCPYCSSRILLEKAKKVASAQDAGEASAILRRLKEKTSTKREKAKF
jgi:DNA-directed RNA polymerase subunit RPC12/RpoP